MSTGTNVISETVQTAEAKKDARVAEVQRAMETVQERSASRGVLPPAAPTGLRYERVTAAECWRGKLR